MAVVAGKKREGGVGPIRRVDVPAEQRPDALGRLFAALASMGWTVKAGI